VVTTSRIIGLTSLNDMDDRTTTMSEMIPFKGRRRRRKGYIKGFPNIDVNLDDIKTVSPIDISSHQVDSGSYRLQPR
jgi:hypothetical protein